jgi:4-hydroxybenzoate polyprenyltransferase
VRAPPPAPRWPPRHQLHRTPQCHALVRQTLRHPLLAHQVTDPERVLHALLAFIAFSLAASAVYIVNDLLDLARDRQRPYKRLRPLASGLVPIPVALAIVPLALVAGTGIAVLLLPGLFTAILLLYLGSTTAYSFFLKRVAILDVLVLASLYTLRVLAGAVATDVPVSPWFLAFFRARGYLVRDADLLRSIGAASGYLAIAVLALYVHSPEVHRLYSQPTVLWLIGPLLLYWISGVWVARAPWLAARRPGGFCPHRWDQLSARGAGRRPPRRGVPSMMVGLSQFDAGGRRRGPHRSIHLA